jgi:hypothetical protein
MSDDGNAFELMIDKPHFLRNCYSIEIVMQTTNKHVMSGIGDPG